MTKPDPALLQRAAPDVSLDVIRQHLARLDDSYFERFDLDDIARHLRSLARLSPLAPADVQISSLTDGSVQCTILGLDAPGFFSIVTGIFASLGFSIGSGDVYTYGPPASQSRPRPHTLDTRQGPRSPSRRRIVDHFVGSLPVDASVAEWADELRRRLISTLILIENHGSEGATAARQRANEWVTQWLEQLDQVEPESPFSAEIEVNRQSEQRLRLLITSKDTPAFLYSLSSALALHDIDIKRIRIRTVAGQVHDELEVQVPSATEFEQWERVIRIVVALTKQFTYFLGSAADPYTALTRFDWLATQATADMQRDDWPDLLASPAAMLDLARLLGASDFLWDDFVRQHYQEVLAAIRDRVSGHAPAPSPNLDRLIQGQSHDQQKRRIVEYRDRQSFLIQLDDILDESNDPDPLSDRLTILAEELIDAATSVVYAELEQRLGPPTGKRGLVRFSLLGLGKFGSKALGYASDLELLLVHDGNPNDRAAASFFNQLMLNLQETLQSKQQGLFELDLRLRPWGKSGPLQSSIQEFESYYAPGGKAHSLERLALTRLRAIAGDPNFGLQVERLRDDLIYQRSWLDLGELADARARQYEQRTGAPNAKYSRGALVDLEYAVQILQVSYGSRFPMLRTPDVEQALRGLAEAGLLPLSEAQLLLRAYTFFRRLINALRMLHGRAEDVRLPPSDTPAALYLARRLGYQMIDRRSASSDLEKEFAVHSAAVQDFVRRYVGDQMLPPSRSRAKLDVSSPGTLEPSGYIASG